MKKCAVLIVLILGLAVLQASAASITYNVSGTTSGGAVSGQIIFSSTGSTNLSIEIKNTSTGIDNIAMVLDGLQFGLSGSTLSLTGASATGTEDCIPGSGSSAICTLGGAATSGSSFGWGLSGSYSLIAGSGSLKPYGIVNTSVNGLPCTLSCDGISNNQHNPYLIDATFTFTGTGINLANIGAIRTYWGTGGETITTSGGGNTPPPPSVPEPATLGLLGSGLMSVAAMARRKFNR